MAEPRTIPIQILDAAPAGLSENPAGSSNQAPEGSPVSGPAPRANPMIWEGEEAATGVFIGGENPLDALDLLGVPGMVLPQVPRLPEDFSPSDRLRAWLDELMEALQCGSEDSVPRRLALAELDEVERQAIGEILGEGEVTAELTLDGTAFRVVESVLAGVWRISAEGEAGWVEVACVPTLVLEAALSLETAPFPVPEGGAGVMNAPAVLVEISERAAHYHEHGPAESAATAPNHVLNFTLLPMSEADHALLTSVLGRAQLELRSGGFGDCKVMATRYRHVWAVQYVNAMGHVILDTVEVGDVPAAVAAAREDMEDSAGRLQEILEAYL
ncbi:MAG: hydrogenase expression/formation protein [Pseudomonadota bacterium]